MRILAVFGVLVASAVASASPCDDAFERGATEDDLEACLPDHATPTGSVGMGLQWNTEVGGTGVGFGTNGALFAGLELPGFQMRS